jgi:predicted phosphohydrolase
VSDDIWNYYGRDLQSELARLQDDMARLRKLVMEVVAQLHYWAIFESENSPEMSKVLVEMADKLEAVCGG